MKQYPVRKEEKTHTINHRICVKAQYQRDAVQKGGQNLGTACEMMCLIYKLPKYLLVLEQSRQGTTRGVMPTGSTKFIT